MSVALPDVWEGRSVLFTSFWGWAPSTWGAVGWTGNRGKSRRDNLLREMTDPFIVALYVTSNAPKTEAHLHGKITGFYLVSHEKGDRDDFTHPVHHALAPEKWRHSLRAVRAFNYLPEYRLDVKQFDSKLLKGAQHVAAMCVRIVDERRLNLLRDTPWEEIAVYRRDKGSEPDFESRGGIVDGKGNAGLVIAGPENNGGYFVPKSTKNLLRQLYILRLDGQVEHIVAGPTEGRRIFKVGLSASPESRREQLQQTLPGGRFVWQIHRTSFVKNAGKGWSFIAAEAGEYAMKEYLAKHGKHLGGEFYLAGDAQVEEAWVRGVEKANEESSKGSHT